MGFWIDPVGAITADVDSADPWQIRYIEGFMFRIYGEPLDSGALYTLAKPASRLQASVVNTKRFAHENC